LEEIVPAGRQGVHFWKEAMVLRSSGDL